MSKKGKTGLEWLLRESEAPAVGATPAPEAAPAPGSVPASASASAAAAVSEPISVDPSPEQPRSKPRSRTDKRAHLRAKVAPFEVRYRKGSEQVVAQGRDLSVGGAFIETTRFLPIGDVFQAQAVFADGRRLAIIAEVIWGTNGDTEKQLPAGLGVKFLDVDDKDVPYLKDLVAAASPSPPVTG